MRFASALAQTWKDYGPDREEVDALRGQGAMQGSEQELLPNTR